MELPAVDKQRLEKAAYGLACLVGLSVGSYYFRDDIGKAVAFIQNTASKTSFIGKYHDDEKRYISLANGQITDDGFKLEVTDMSPDEVYELEEFVLAQNSNS